MIIQNSLGDKFYINDEDVRRDDEFGLYGQTEPDNIDSVGFENFFHSLPKEELEVMICLFLGMTPTEIVEAFHFKNIARFYNVSARLRESYKERKQEFMV